MYYHVIEAKYIEKYKIRLKFEDGKNGEIDFLMNLMDRFLSH